MNKMLPALAAVTLGLALGCCYLYSRAQEEGARTAVLGSVPDVSSIQPDAPAQLVAHLREIAMWRSTVTPVIDDPLRVRFELEERLKELYLDLGPALGLKPNQADRFIDLLSSQPAFFVELSHNGDAIEQVRQQVRSNYESLRSSIVTELGTAVSQKWRIYLSTLRTRHQLTELRRRLAEAGMPLLGGRLETLITVLAESDRRALGERPPEHRWSPACRAEQRLKIFEQRVRRDERSSRRKRTALAAHLTERELAVLDGELLRVRKAYAEVRASLRSEASSEAEGRAWGYVNRTEVYVMPVIFFNDRPGGQRVGRSGSCEPDAES